MDDSDTQKPGVIPAVQAVVEAFLSTDGWSSAGRSFLRRLTEEQRAVALEGAMALAQALEELAWAREAALATGAIDENGSDGVDHRESDHWQEVRLALNSTSTRQRLADMGD